MKPPRTDFPPSLIDYVPVDFVLELFEIRVKLTVLEAADAYFSSMVGRSKERPLASFFSWRNLNKGPQV